MKRMYLYQIMIAHGMALHETINEPEIITAVDHARPGGDMTAILTAERIGPSLFVLDDMEVQAIRQQFIVGMPIQVKPTYNQKPYQRFNNDTWRKPRKRNKRL